MRAPWLYSFRPAMLVASYDEMIEACRAQGIAKVGLLAAVSGTYTVSLEALAALAARLRGDGIDVWAEVFAVGHPSMERTHGQYGAAAETPMHYRGGRVWEDGAGELSRLPEGWSYARNEFTSCVRPPPRWEIAIRRAGQRIVATSRC